MATRRPYLTSAAARRQNLMQVGDFMVPAEEFALCTCHGKRWPLRLLVMENSEDRHCPQTVSPQGGVTDRDRLAAEDQAEVARGTRDESRANRWPIPALENVPTITLITPRPQKFHLGITMVVVVTGTNLTSADVIELPDGLEMDDPPVWSVDGTTCTLSLLSDGTGVAGLHPLTYAGNYFDNVFKIYEEA